MLFVLVLPSVSFGLKFSQYGLEGISEFGILIADLDKATLEMGLSKKLIKRTVELKLRLAGIKVVESSTQLIVVTYKVHPFIVDGALVGHEVSLRLSMRQPVLLERNRDYVVFAVPTWDDGSLNLLPKSSGTGAVIDQLEMIMDKFLLQYLKANPK
jgi:hypothetical protein